MRCAPANGHHAYLRALVKHNPSSTTLDAKLDPLGHALLHFAVRYGDEDCVLLLLMSGANPNVQNRYGQTPLHLAASRRDLIVLRHLMNADLNLHIEDFWGDTAFELAISSPFTTTDKAAVIRVFLESILAQDDTLIGLGVELNEAVEFLSMGSIYHSSSEENIFKASSEGENIALLLLKQSEMNDLAEDLHFAVFGK